MSLNINFDHNWTYHYHGTTHEDDITTLTVTSAVDDFDWSPVELPHSIHAKNGSTINNTKFHQCWYRKQFQCIQSEQQLMQAVCLTFKSSGDNTRNIANSTISTLSAVIWLDRIKIFSGSLRERQISMDLPEKLLNSDHIEKNRHKHTLIVCCMNTSLSFNALLTVPCNTIFNVQEVQFNGIIKHTANLKQQHDIGSDQSNSSEITDVRIHTGSTSTPLSPSSTYEQQEFSDTTTEEAIKREKNHTDHYLDGINRDNVPLLTIVMLIVGTRGDVEPLIAYGKALHAVGHRVRLATHEKFRKFVRANNLEFFPLAGDPAEIMSFMVQNSGIIPSLSTIIKGDIFKRREVFFDILQSTWLACTSADDETGALFRAEAIIANPISYGHIHCAQKLGIPLHMVFTMPYSTTAAFPHPLSSLDYSKTPRARLNVFSYTLVETIMWMGIGDLINKFRQTVLDLPPLHMRQVISMMIDEKVPYTYCWSPSLIPKPSDWPSYIDVSGYFFLNLGKSYTTPPNDLLAFLGLHPSSNNETNDLSPPIFIGFGSITGHDSRRLLDIIFKALEQTGHRALLSGFDIETNHLPKTILKIEDIPYDWLFPHVSVVCHHGGAGTTAAGLRAGKASIIMPFFGDQFFWGSIVGRSGAGPPPLPGKDVTVAELVEAFKFAHKPTTQAAAKRLQEAISNENGCIAAVHAFHSNLPRSQMRSDLEPTFPACFRLDEFNLQVSRPVAQVLLLAGVVNESQFRYHCTRNWQLSHNNTGESSLHDRPRTNDFQLFTTAVKTSVYHSSKNDTQNSVNKSRVNYRYRGNSTGAVETSIAGNIGAAKFIMSALLSSTELDQNNSVNAQTNSSKDIDALKQTTVNQPSNTSTLLSSNTNGPLHCNSIDMSIFARNAASISGFSPEVCQNILFEFNKLRRPRVQMPMFSSIKHPPSRLSTLRRSQSFDGF